MEVGGGFGAVTGVLGCLAVFEFDGASASHAAQSVLAMRVIDAVVRSIKQSLVREAVAVHLFFWGAALASLDCCSFSFLVLGFVGGLQFRTDSYSTCPSVANTFNAIPGVSGVGCWVRALSVVLLRAYIMAPSLRRSSAASSLAGLGNRVLLSLLTCCDADADSGVRVFERRCHNTDPDDRC